MKYDGYRPHDADKFSQMKKLLGAAKTELQLDQLMMLYLLDRSYHREDILVAQEHCRVQLKEKR